jgi:predicted phage tail component-like protein
MAVGIRSFTFNGLSSTPYIKWINKIKRGYMPPIEVPFAEIPNRAGAAAYKRNKIGVRQIEIEITLDAVSFADMRARVRSLAMFLIYTDAKELIFSDEPGKKYLARFNSTGTDLEELIYTGTGTITFTCFDPYAYSLNEQTLLGTGNAVTFTNAGTAPLYPRLRVYPNIDLEFVKFTNEQSGKIALYDAPWPAATALVIDCNKNRVYRESDGANMIANLSLDSEFFSIAPGPVTIRLTDQTPDSAGVNNVGRVYWTERFY